MHAHPARFLPLLAHLTARSAQAAPSLLRPALHHASDALPDITAQPTHRLGLALIAVEVSTVQRGLGFQSRVHIKCPRLADGVS